MSYGGFAGGRGGDDSSSTMMVESANVGKIIGRQGSKIRELEQESNARIKISRDEDGDGMKSVEISGSQEEIERARKLIEECLSFNDYGGGNRRGFGGGRGGGRGGYRRDDGYGDDRGYGRRDNDRGFGRRDDNRGFGRRDDGDGGFGRRAGGGWGGQRGGGGFGEGGESETIYVETSEVGRIIGRGGSRIRDMETDSGCRIKVSKDGSRGQSSVELSGSKDAILEAKRLIEGCGVEIVNGRREQRGW